MSPHRPLDFIVFGVPRSGTKGLARALNLHPNVYCSFERFSHRASHAELVFPDSFTATRDLHTRQQLRKHERMVRELATKPDVRHVGNKTPRYYLELERINAELPQLKNLWIYRSPAGFMQSWNRKEANSATSASWQRGQVGLFGVLELLSCLDACLRSKRDILVFPYEAGLNRSAEAITDALDFLGADPAAFDHRTFVSEILPMRPNSARSHDYERALLETLDVKSLDLILDQDRCFLLSTVRGPLQEYLASIRDRLPTAIDQAFAACRGPAVIVYGTAWLARDRDALERLVAMTSGSIVMAELQRYTIARRVKSLYFQRGSQLISRSRAAK